MIAGPLFCPLLLLAQHFTLEGPQAGNERRQAAIERKGKQATGRNNDNGDDGYADDTGPLRKVHGASFLRFTVTTGGVPGCDELPGDGKGLPENVMPDIAGTNLAEWFPAQRPLSSRLS